MAKIKATLKTKLVLANALTKTLLVVIIVFIIPWWISRISVNDTDDALIKKLDQVLYLVDSLGIENYIDQDAELKSFGSYNILKDEYISIEELYADSSIQYIDFTQRVIEGEVVDYRVLSYSIDVANGKYLIEIGKSVSAIFDFESKLKQFAFWIIGLILLISIFIDLSVNQLLLRPLHKIINKLATTNHPTSFNYNEIASSTTDIIYMNQTINKLMHKIEEAFNTEREYISNVSHELLTPISIIKSKLDNIIMDGKLSDVDMLKVYDSKKTLGRLTKMVRTFLMMSRIENQEYLLTKQFDLVPIVKQVIKEISDKAEAKNIDLKYELPIPIIIEKGNADLLFNVFYNFINNAIKYTQSGGVVVIGEQTKNQQTITVADTGLGIPREQIPHIFDRFKKFSSQKESFGLGLALTKKICDYHKIQIVVESEVNIGTRFKLIL